MGQVLKREFLISKANVRSTGKRAWIHVWWVEFIYSVVPPFRNKLTESPSLLNKRIDTIEVNIDVITLDIFIKL
ncbi:hypothetical protein DSO57_1020531 [Entomophthora muscae]|uniref:Uncharacterized protein n=1 Tax=Entomophthora muscae TaxID=34485 RepID=A0ACC2S5Q4_9FUNG|nr:hypothetical protein DSO57_1020531 [Entomophthora muscae]